MFVEQARAVDTNNAVAAMLYDGTSSNRIEIRSYLSPNFQRYSITSSGAPQLDKYLYPVSSVGEFDSSVIGYAYNDTNVALNGASSTVDTTVIVPIVNQLRLRESTFGVEYNGHIRRLTYWPRRQSDSTLQVITE